MRMLTPSYAWENGVCIGNDIDKKSFGIYLL